MLISHLICGFIVYVAAERPVTKTVTRTITETICSSATLSPDAPKVPPITQAYSFIGPSAASLDFNTVLTGYSSAAQTAFKHSIVLIQAQEDDPIGYMLSSDNSQSGNIFMGLVKQIAAAPNTNYALNFTVDFLTNVAAGCAGIGASPGDNVYVEVGATGANPSVGYTDSTGLFEFQNLNTNVNLTLAGNFGSEMLKDCYDTTRYVSKELSTGTNYPVSSDDNGNIWLLVGTNSYFEGTTSIYWQNLNARLTPIS